MPTDHDIEIPPAPTDVDAPVAGAAVPVDGGGDAPVDDAGDDAPVDGGGAVRDGGDDGNVGDGGDDAPVDGVDDVVVGDGGAVADGGPDEEAAARRPGTTHPRLARERALKVLFQADVRGEDARLALDRIESTRGALALLDELEPDPDQVDAEPDLRLELTRRARLPLDDYTRQLVGGVASRRSAIDRLLGRVSDNWAVARMPVVDRNLLRLAVHELVVEDTPHPIVIDEAVALARGFAGDKAVSFVNGVLEAVRQAVARGDVDLGDSASLPEPAAVPSAAAADGAPGGEHGDDARGSGAAGSEAAGTEAAGSEAAEQPAPDEHAAAAWSDALDLLGMTEPEPAPASAAETETVEVPESGDGPRASGDPDGPEGPEGAEGAEWAEDEDDLDPETEVAILLGELGPDGEPLDDDAGSPDGSADDLVDDGAGIAADPVDDGSDTGFDDEGEDRFEGFDDLEGAEQDSLFGDLDDED